MAVDLHISFRGMEPSPAAEAQVRRRADELEQFSDRISACRVVLEAVDRHHQHGRIYQARVDLKVAEVFVSPLERRVLEGDFGQ